MISYLYFIAAFIVLVVIVPGIRFVQRNLRVPKKGESKYFRDSHGRIQIFRGVNVCNASKDSEDMLPWHTEKEYRMLKEHGFNVVRFLVFWEAIEPEEDKYDEGYIKKLKDHIKILNDLGISVIIDIHQDLFNKKFTGNGFPDWALPSNLPKFTPRSPWYMNYFQKAVIASYKNFWKSEKLQQKYVDMFVYLHEQIKELPNILGIDIMNEPYPTLPFIFSFEKNRLSHLYQDIQMSLPNENRLPLFFEPAIQSSLGLPSYVKCFGGRILKRYIPHYYSPFCHNKGVYRFIDKWLMETALKVKAREAQIHGSPFIIGEFGFGCNVSNRVAAVKDFMKIADTHSMSWTWYTYDYESDSTQGLLSYDGQPNAIMALLSKPFPYFIAGSDPVFYYDGYKFCLEYESDPEIKAPTEIYIPGLLGDVKTNTSFDMSSVGSDTLKFYNIEQGKQRIEISWQYSLPETPTAT